MKKKNNSESNTNKTKHTVYIALYRDPDFPDELHFDDSNPHDTYERAFNSVPDQFAVGTLTWEE